MSPDKPLSGRVIVVTGASSGIGQAAARAFARAGARVVLAARRAERLAETAAGIEAEGGQALAVPTDVTEPSQIRRLVERALEQFGRIDVLANVAGWGKYHWIEAFEPGDIRQQYSVNVVGMAELISEVVPVMQRQRSGHIVNMASYASRIAVPPLTIYASTKYAVEGLSDGLRRELAPWGIRVSRVHPAGVSGTEFNAKAKRRGGLRYRSVPFGRRTREQVAEELVDLVARPRRALYLGRVYEAAVLANRLLPGLVDALTWVWMRVRRRKELAGPAQLAAPAAAARARHRRGASWLLPLAAGLAVAVVGWAWRQPPGRTRL
jgi:NAD(P)-dependent dehydrogenase (short-subunit alcohol dehydrogenase family)